MQKAIGKLAKYIRERLSIRIWELEFSLDGMKIDTFFFLSERACRKFLKENEKEIRRMGLSYSYGGVRLWFF